MIPDGRTKSHKLQLRVYTLWLGDPAQPTKERSAENKAKLKSLVVPKSQVKLQLRVHMLRLGDPAQPTKERSAKNKAKLKSLVVPKSQVKQKDLVFFRVYRR